MIKMRALAALEMDAESYVSARTPRSQNTTAFDTDSVSKGVYNRCMAC